MVKKIESLEYLEELVLREAGVVKDKRGKLSNLEANYLLRDVLTDHGDNLYMERGSLGVNIKSFRFGGTSYLSIDNSPILVRSRSIENDYNKKVVSLSNPFGGFSLSIPILEGPEGIKLESDNLKGGKDGRFWIESLKDTLHFTARTSNYDVEIQLYNLENIFYCLNDEHSFGKSFLLRDIFNDFKMKNLGEHEIQWGLDFLSRNRETSNEDLYEKGKLKFAFGESLGGKYVIKTIFPELISSKKAKDYYKNIFHLSSENDKTFKENSLPSRDNYISHFNKIADVVSYLNKVTNDFK